MVEITNQSRPQRQAVNELPVIHRLSCLLEKINKNSRLQNNLNVPLHNISSTTTQGTASYTRPQLSSEKTKLVCQLP